MGTQHVAPAPLLGGDVRVDDSRVTVLREDGLQSERMDALVRDAVFGQGQARDHARWLIWEIGQAVGCVRHPSTICTWLAGAGTCMASPCRQ